MSGAPLSADRLSLRVQSIARAARDIHLVELALPGGGALPPASPGAHIELHLDSGISRSYSLVHAGDALTAYVVGVKRDPHSRGGSRYVHEQMRVGATLAVSPPRNHFPLREDAVHSVLIAGGIGITPIWCMAQRLAALGVSWELHYSARSRDDLAFAPALAAFGDRVRLHCDEEAGGVLDLAAIVCEAPASAHFYCCGPAPMLAAFERATAHLPPPQVHLERFAPQQAAAVAGGFVVALARSGRELEVPAGASVLSVLLANGIGVEHSCRAGLCGCCEVGVLAGEVDHRDACLTEAERAGHRSMLVCVSGAKSARLVLDL
jgi:ferredoxin-NADP reductase